MKRALVVLGFVFASGAVFIWLASSQSEAQDAFPLSRLNGPVEDAEIMKLQAEWRQERMVRTALGSSVYLRDNRGNAYSGLFAGITKDEIEVRSCISRDVIDMPGGKQQLKTSLPPYAVFPVSSIRDFQVFDVPTVDLETLEEPCGICIEEIVFKDGRRQKWVPGEFVFETVSE